MHDCLSLKQLFSEGDSLIKARSYFNEDDLYLDKPPDDIDPIDRRELVAYPSVLTFEFEKLLDKYD